MILPPVPQNEADRLGELHRLRLFEVTREVEFDRIAQQASDLFETKIGLVSLVLDREQCFLGACGLTAPSTSRDIAFCAHALGSDEVLVVPDATLDPRFADNPLVTGPPHIRFYAGAPLCLSPDIRLGTLCIADPKARAFDERSRRRLAAMAETVIDLVRYRLEKELHRESEARIAFVVDRQQEVLDAMPIAIAVYDSNDRLMTTSRTFKTMFNVHTEEVLSVGMRTTEVRSLLEASGNKMEHLVQDRNWLRSNNERRRVRRYPGQISTADGRTMLHLEVVTSSKLLVTIDLDVSDLKAREATIAAQEALLRTALETLEHGVVILDAEQRVLMSNARFGDLLDLPEELLSLGASLDALSQFMVENNVLGQAAWNSIYHGYTHALTGQVTKIRRIETSEGRTFDFTCASTADQKMVVTVTDVTEQRELERMKDEFTSTVSHELRTPLTSISGALTLLGVVADGLLPERAEKLLDIAGKNCARLIRLINDMLEVSKLEDGNLELSLGPVVLDNMLKQAVEHNLPYAENLGVRIVLEIRDAGLTVEADMGRLEQVLANLLSNAAKFSPRGETVTVSLTREGQVARIIVADKGVGIPAAFRSRVFQRYAQADGTTRRKYGGSGLGLWITRSIIERHGGSIDFSAGSDGVGTVFHVDLPLISHRASTVANRTVAEQGKGDKKLVPMSQERTRRRRILHVEDDKDLRSLIAQAFGTAADVVGVNDLSEARELLSSQEGKVFDLVILDIGLPDGVGLELLPVLEARARRRVPVVVYSAFPTRGEFKMHDLILATFTKGKVSVDGLVTKVLELTASEAFANGDTDHDGT